MTRTSHKFRLKTDKVNKSFSNPLYSKKSLDRYYYQKQNKNYSSQATLSRSVKKIPSKSEGTINILIKNLSKFHENQGCTSKKIKLLSNYQ